MKTFDQQEPLYRTNLVISDPLLSCVTYLLSTVPILIAAHFVSKVKGPMTVYGALMTILSLSWWAIRDDASISIGLVWRYAVLQFLDVPYTITFLQFETLSCLATGLMASNSVLLLWAISIAHYTRNALIKLAMPPSAVFVPILLALCLDLSVVRSLTPTEASVLQADLLTLGVPIVTLCVGMSVILIAVIRALPGQAEGAEVTFVETEDA